MSWTDELMKRLLALRDIHMISEEREKVMKDAFAYYRRGRQQDLAWSYSQFKGVVYQMNGSTNVRQFMKERLGVDVRDVPDESWNS